MELLVIQSRRGWSSSQLLFTVPALGSGSLSIPHANPNAIPNYALPPSLSGSTLSINVKKPRIHPRKPRTTVIPHRALLDDTPSNLAPTKVADADRFLTVKKRAAEISTQLKGTSVFLVGISSSIKSNLGEILAEALRYYYFDSDALVEEAAGGKATAKSLKEKDEKGFHDSEYEHMIDQTLGVKTQTEVLKQLSSMGRLVVSAGDGAVQCAANLALLRHGISIWIDIPLGMVATEVVKDNIQLPASEFKISASYSEVLTHLTIQYEESRGGYATADSTVSLQKVASKLGYEDLDAVTVEDLVLEVLNEIEKLTRLKKMMEAAARPF